MPYADVTQAKTKLHSMTESSICILADTELYNFARPGIPPPCNELTLVQQYRKWEVAKCRLKDKVVPPTEPSTFPAKFCPLRYSLSLYYDGKDHYCGPRKRISYF